MDGCMEVPFKRPEWATRPEVPLGVQNPQEATRPLFIISNNVTLHLSTFLICNLPNDLKNYSSEIVELKENIDGAPKRLSGG
jgi:hypothetical protein